MRSDKSIILMVDDNPINLLELSDLLNESGFDVLRAETGENALEQAVANQPDLILLDVLMPGMDGFATCRQLKDNLSTQDIPVLFMTALADTADKVKGFHLGAVDYITKPFQYEEVIARVQTHITLQKLKLAERERLHQELAIAQGIQRSLLPASMPIIAGYDIAGWSQSAEETGGDFFDFHVLDDGHLILTLADVSGHGMGPALLAAECWALQRAAFSWSRDYRSSLTRINQLICRHIPSDRFITAFIGRLSAKRNSLNFLSAGHGPVFILRVAENRIETLPVTGMPLGIMADNRYEQWQTTPFNPGDILIAFTDGFFEWEDRSGNCFGTDRICEVVFRHAELPASAIIECVHRDLLGFTAGTRQQDDLTAVVIKKLPFE